MKTNQILTREMGLFTVNQRTSDFMFNATELLKQWNAFSGQQKQMVHYFENESTNEFIEALMEEENLKERNSVYLKSRGKTGGTWMHPLLFIDYAMWLNPAFKVKVLKFVYDELIRFRHDAGDAYPEMTAAISKIVKKDFQSVAIQNIAKAVNFCIWNEHETGLRNKKAEEGKLREVAELERDIAKMINMGFVKNYDQLINYLRRIWDSKWSPKILNA